MLLFAVRNRKVDEGSYFKQLQSLQMYVNVRRLV